MDEEKQAQGQIKNTDLKYQTQNKTRKKKKKKIEKKIQQKQ